VSELDYAEPSLLRASEFSREEVEAEASSSVNYVFIMRSNLSANTLRYRSAMIRKPSIAKVGTAEGFRGNLTKVLPELKGVSEKDLEKLIGEGRSDDLDNE